jgi:hypothetical protein
MIEDLHILAVGSAPLHSIVRDALRILPHCRLSVADGLRHLWLAPRGDVADVVILDSTLSPLDLEDAGRLIRHQWPAAGILILRSDLESLDDALYDEHMPPAATPAALLGAIERLTGRCRKGGLG